MISFKISINLLRWVSSFWGTGSTVDSAEGNFFSHYTRVSTAVIGGATGAT
jgi:hypothetical protein